MTQAKANYPLKIGLAMVAVAYFVFTLHALFTLSWIGEWEGLPERVAFWIFVSDITATFFLVFRFIAGLIAVTAVALYFKRHGLSEQSKLKYLKLILVFEALYWVGLITSGVWGILPTNGLNFNIGLLITTGIPCMVSSIAIPLALFKLVTKLKPSKPQKEAIKWGLITGAIYAFVFWLNNMGMWIVTAIGRGWEFLTVYPENLLSFALTVFGLLALALYTTYFAKKHVGAESLEPLKIGIGAILTMLGLYFLWNYLTWIYFGGWSEWYAWFLGHNLDLWLLVLPLLGLPLLFSQKSTSQQNEAEGQV